MKKLIIGLFLLIFLSCDLNAAIICVTPAGNDSNDGLGWADTHAKHTVTGALLAAVSGDEIWVKAGTYSETACITMKQGVSIYGGFFGNETALVDRPAFPRTSSDSNETILNGQNLSDCVVYVPSGITNADKLDGFTITNGIGRLVSSDRHGGAIYCNGGSPIISNNRIINNSADCGAGIFVEFSMSPIIINNYISGNSAESAESDKIDKSSGGGIYSKECLNITISSNTISENSSQYGGGLLLTGSDETTSNATISGNIITNNVLSDIYTYTFGAGIFCNNMNATIIANQISNNSSNGSVDGVGGGIHTQLGDPIITCNTLSNNNGSFGGGISIYITGSSTISNNIIKNNICTYYGGGILLFGASGIIKNNTICSNTSQTVGGVLFLFDGSDAIFSNNINAYNSSGIYAHGTSTISINYNNFYPVASYNYYPDTLLHPSDISCDPLFVNISGGDYHLQNTPPNNISPCIDAGDNTYVTAGDKDIDGQDRISTLAPANVDIGADEYWIKLPSPTFNPSAGTYNSSQSPAVSISCSMNGASIYYTTDGSTPNNQSTPYSDSTPISVGASMTIKAIAYKTDYSESDVSSAQYVIIDTSNPSPGIASSPSVSSTSPITVSFTGASDTGGSGLKNVGLWYKKGMNGTWTNSGLLISGSSSGTFNFMPSQNAGTYYFYLVAEDNVGNRSTLPSSMSLGQCSTVYSNGITNCSFINILLP